MEAAPDSRHGCRQKGDDPLQPPAPHARSCTPRSQLMHLTDPKNRFQLHSTQKKEKSTKVGIDEWKGYFQMVNGRDPSSDDLQQAVKKKWRCPTRHPRHWQLTKHRPATGESPYSIRMVCTVAGVPAAGPDVDSRHADSSQRMCTNHRPV